MTQIETECNSLHGGCLHPVKACEPTDTRHPAHTTEMSKSHMAEVSKPHTTEVSLTLTMADCVAVAAAADSSQKACTVT